MFTLSRTRIAKRIAVLFASVLLVATGVFVALKQNKTEETNAATGDGDYVTITYTGDIGHQGDWPGWNGVFHSPPFSVNSGTATGFCIDAWLSVVDSGSRIRAYKRNNDAMKLAIYIYTVSNSATNAALSQLGISRDDNGFARIHAIVSYINRPEYTETGYTEEERPGWNDMVAWIKEKTGIIRGYITSNADVWQMAKNYQLYTLDGSATTDSSLQNIAWIEPAFGSIKVQKHDYDTNNTTPQGNASLQGIHFQVINSDNNSVVAEGNTGADGSVTFQNLLAGVNYKVKETTTGSTNTSYTVTNSETASINLTTSGHTFDVKNQVKRGKITLKKVDKETGTCDKKTSELSFKDTKFQIINNSTNPVYINGSSYAKNAVIETKTFGENDCNVTFENLPYGSYQIKEIAAGTGYVLNATPINVTIPTNNNYNVETTVSNQPIRGDVKFIKKSREDGDPMENVLFSISALDKDNNIKETHLVVSNAEGIVDTSSSFILHSANTNGYDVLYDASEPIVFSSYGTWFGKDNTGASLPVDDTVGALPYGKYLIQELKCDANFFCTNTLNQKKTITIDTDKQIVDLGDWNNSCTEFSLETSAHNPDNDSFYIEGQGEATIVDEIDYCVKPNMNFTVKGILMDKETGEPLLINGKTVESEIKLNSETECGTTEMEFTFDATDLGGKEIVVFEKLYYQDDLITSHEDINDEAQTIYVLSLTTYAENKETGEKTLPLGEDVTIKDTVKYCVIPGHSYIIKGVLMDKTTGNGLLMNSEPVEQEVVIENPEEACGEVVMEYDINTTGLGGSELVIFETLYLAEPGEEEGEYEPVYELIAHKDFDNEAETVRVELPAPETGAVTTKKEGSNETGNIIFIVATVTVCVSGYIIMRRVSRKNFFKR